MMLCNPKQYYRSIGTIFHHSRRSLFQTRQLEDLKQLYELLKEESASKTHFHSKFLFCSYRLIQLEMFPIRKK